MGWLSQCSCVTTFVVSDVLVSLAVVTNSLQISVAHTKTHFHFPLVLHGGGCAAVATILLQESFLSKTQQRSCT